MTEEITTDKSSGTSCSAADATIQLVIRFNDAMKNSRLSSLARAIIVVAVLAAATACNLPTAQTGPAPATGLPPTNTNLPPTAVTPSAGPLAQAPPSATPEGVHVSGEGDTFTIPPGLGTGAGLELVAASAPDGPPWDAAPAHRRFILQGYPAANTLHAIQPVIYIYPAQAYAAANAGAAGSLEKLKAILASPPERLSKDDMPRAVVNAELTLAANMQTLGFQNGSGVRMLAFYTQAYTPVTNQYLAYYFHGLTADGGAYVVATLPIDAPFLQQNGVAALPEGGIPMPADANAYTAYIEQVAARLDAAGAEGSLAPALAALDALVQSLRVNAVTSTPAAPPPATVQPGTTTPASCSDAAEFVKDVTIPDGTVFKPGERFTKTWQLKNTGSCTWTPDYRLVFKSGEHMDGPDEAPLTAGNFVAPGGLVDVSVELQAPEKNGNYTSFWAVRNAAGQFLPIARTEKDQFFVQISVGALGFQVTKASITYTYVSGPIGQLCTWAKYTLTASVTANGLGIVAYQWLETRSGSVIGSGTLSFNGPGTQTIQIALNGPFSVPTVMNIALATDKPDRTWSPVQITCTQD